jgi:hypothetical protein
VGRESHLVSYSVLNKHGTRSGSLCARTRTENPFTRSWNVEINNRRSSTLIALSLENFSRIRGATRRDKMAATRRPVVSIAMATGVPTPASSLPARRGGGEGWDGMGWAGMGWACGRNGWALRVGEDEGVSADEKGGREGGIHRLPHTDARNFANSSPFLCASAPRGCEFYGKRTIDRCSTAAKLA